MDTHPFEKDWLDCCKTCGEGIENQTPGRHGELAPGTLEALIERMTRAEKELSKLAEDATSPRESQRLYATSQGMHLALSYAQEELRLGQGR